MKKKIITPALILSLGLLTAPQVHAAECEANDLINQTQNLVEELDQNTKDLNNIKKAQKPDEKKTIPATKIEDIAKPNKTDETKPSTPSKDKKDDKTSDKKEEKTKKTDNKTKEDKKEVKKVQKEEKKKAPNKNVKTGIASLTLPTLATLTAAFGALIKSKRK